MYPNALTSSVKDIPLSLTHSPTLQTSIVESKPSQKNGKDFVKCVASLVQVLELTHTRNGENRPHHVNWWDLETDKVVEFEK